MGSFASHEPNEQPSVTEKCYDPYDPQLKFVDADDDHDFLCVGYKSKRAKMSCGHTVTPMSLTDWCQMQLDQGKTRFECGSCKKVWPFGEVHKMALLTETEKKAFEKKLFQNIATNKLRAKFCPSCKSHSLRKDPTNLCVICPQCTADKGKRYQFCWQCLREWKGSAPRSDRCENDECVNEVLQTLKTCPDINFTEVTGVTGCPIYRACPTCGLLVGHKGDKCKNITCRDCKVEFCFVCLKTTKECLKTSRHYKACDVAPRQTFIPVWTK